MIAVQCYQSSKPKHPSLNPPSLLHGKLHALRTNAPKDTEEDRGLAEAAIKIQKAWRGWERRKRTRWVRMEREGRRRLSCLRKEVEAEQDRARALEVLQKDGEEK